MHMGKVCQITKSLLFPPPPPSPYTSSVRLSTTQTQESWPSRRRGRTAGTRTHASAERQERSLRMANSEAGL